MDKKSEKHLFWIGILFVICAYMAIKVVDRYQDFFGILKNIYSIIFPFILAFIIAYMLNPIVGYFEKKLKFSRGASVGITYLLIIAIIVISIRFISPIIYRSIMGIMSDIQENIPKLLEWINNLDLGTSLFDPHKITEAISNFMASMPNYLGKITSYVGTIFNTTYAFVNGVIDIFIAFVVSFFVLKEKEKFISYTKKVNYIIFRKKLGNRILFTARMLHSNIGKYLIAKAIDSFFVAVCAVFGLLLIGSKYALLLGIVFGIANMIPYFGPIITTVIAVGINLFVSPMKAVLTLVVLLVIQQIENLILDPKICGAQLGLSPFFTLLAVSLGGSLFGILGMILASPVMSIIKMYSVSFINKEYSKIEGIKE